MKLHRVWKVTATLKEGKRHIYAKRVFYIDEDTVAGNEIDHYDGRGELWLLRAHNLMYYDTLVPWYAIETLYDLNSGRSAGAGSGQRRTGFLSSVSSVASGITLRQLCVVKVSVNLSNIR